MYKKGDHVVYGTRGVCKVTSIETLNMTGEDREYYLLEPGNSLGSTIYCPVDNVKVIMRPILSNDEVESLFDEINGIDVMSVVVDKQRENMYKDALATCDCRELIRVIKTIFFRRIERINEGKKVTAVDEKYYKLAEDILYGELAVALGTDKEAVSKRVLSYIEG